MVERAAASSEPARGVQLPLSAGKRSSLQCTRDLLAAAAEPVDRALAQAIRAEPDWRSNYPLHLRRLTASAARASTLGVASARAGLERLYASFEFSAADGEAEPIPRAMARSGAAPVSGRVVRGRASPPAELAIPYRGAELRGRALLDMLAEWERRGVVEAPFGDALRAVVANPHWLSLSGRRVCLLGAGAEMAPTELLLRWGAEVIAVDLPRPELWQRLSRAAESGAGSLWIPRCDEAGAPRDGVDLLAQTPEIARWVESFGGPLLVANYVYAPGQDFIRVAVAADAVCAQLQTRGELSLLSLATPTDVFAVPIQAVRAARERLHEGSAVSKLAGPIHFLSGGRMMIPNYRDVLKTDDGTELGIADGLVVQQGVNYALAKRIQYWRTLVASAAGQQAMLHVAPPTRTRSVLQSKLLSAVYAGAAMFGMETFAPETSRALMAALLVHDLRAGEAKQSGKQHVARAQHELTAAAMHGGMWRIGWEPRTALPFAVVRGALAFLR